MDQPGAIAAGVGEVQADRPDLGQRGGERDGRFEVGVGLLRPGREAAEGDFEGQRQ